MFTRTAIVLVLVTTVALAASEEPANSEGRIKQLREERVAVLNEIHEAVLALRATGAPGGEIEQVRQAKTELLRARLELATTREQRIKIHEELVGLAKSSLEFVTALADRGAPGGTPINVLKAKAYYLESQIALEQAKAGN